MVLLYIKWFKIQGLLKEKGVWNWYNKGVGILRIHEFKKGNDKFVLK